ncbi:acyltransferase family protein [Rathayibacter toxicus]|uniref:acyltransferase family protein n=1 Tax=Rathayibacter toxicus TaxID=145458 RepID=UPI000CE8341B|nr:acyltransferase family protein [Rathayibacter toxicus]PPI56322.1 acyltransferase [Rathayibacter toxicus]QOD09880.1 acyltransferase family protein [Rathayibacter toxicus]
MKRVVGIDAVRILGMVAIVAGHVWTTEECRWMVFPWHVPLFFMISGRLWTRKRDVGTDIRTRVQTLLVPYLSWLLIIGALLAGSLIARKWPFTADGVFRFIFGNFGRPFTAFWFVTCLFVAVLVLRLLQRFPMWVPTVIAVTGLVVAYISPELVSAVPWSAGTAIPSLVFVLAGYGLTVWAPQRPVLVGSIGLAGGVALVVSRVAEPLDIRASQFGTPIFSVLAAIAISGGLILLGEKAFERATDRVAIVVGTLASAILVVVFTHAAILTMLRFNALVAFAVVAVSSWGLGLLLIRLPHTQFLTGVRSRQNKSAPPASKLERLPTTTGRV